MNLPKSAGEPASTAPAQVGKASRQLGVCEASINFLVEFVEDLRGRVLGRADTGPCARLVTWQKIAHRRKVRQSLPARRRCNRQWPQFTASDVLDGWGTVANIICNWPPSISVSAGASPRYGTWTMSISAIILNSSPDRWSAVPLPPDPMFTLLALTLA